jgi:hypothetical protein
VAQRPFVTYLMAIGRLRPGYDYLTPKIGGLLTKAGRGPLAGEITTFTTAATELDYSGHTVRCATERVIVRLLIQTGRPLAQLNAADLDELAAALHRRTQASGKPAAWAADRAMISTARRVLFHLGILDTPPADPGYLAVLGAQHADALTLAADAETRGWGAEAGRHRRLADRLDQLISQTRAETR